MTTNSTETPNPAVTTPAPAAPAAPVAPAPEAPKPAAKYTDEQMQILAGQVNKLSQENYRLKIEQEANKKLNERLATTTPAAQPAAPAAPANPRWVTDQNAEQVLGPVIVKGVEAALTAKEQRQQEEERQAQAAQIEATTLDETAKGFLKNFGQFYEQDPKAQELIISEALPVARQLQQKHGYSLQQALERTLLGAVKWKYQAGTTVASSVPGSAEVSTQAHAPITTETERQLGMEKLKQMEAEHKVSPEDYLREHIRVHGDPATAHLRK